MSKSLEIPSTGQRQYTLSVTIENTRIISLVIKGLSWTGQVWPAKYVGDFSAQTCANAGMLSVPLLP